MCCTKQNPPFFSGPLYERGFGLGGSASPRFVLPLVNLAALTVASVRRKVTFCPYETILRRFRQLQNKDGRRQTIFSDTHLFLVLHRRVVDLSFSARRGYFVGSLVRVLLCSLKKEALDELQFN